MNTTPIRPARIILDADGTPRSADFGDLYHPREGALAQARHVFLAGSDLPARWQKRERFVILETGFGLGNNFLAAWDAWRTSASRCERLVFVSVEAMPPSRDDLARASREGGLAPLAAELVQQWPPLTCNLHRLAFEAGAVQLLLAFGEVADWLPQLGAEVDAFFLDGFAPALNPAMWEPHLFKAMGRLATPGATVATWTAARTVREGLRSAGFEVRLAPGAGHKRDITLARFAPSFPRRTAPGRGAARPAAGRHASDPIVVVGAGLAGCAVAAELAEHGRHTLLLERRSEIASEGSGNAAGLLHGVVHAADSRHARFYRAAALAAQSRVGRAIEAHGVAGCLAGLLRLEQAGDPERMQAIIDAQALPADYVRAVDAAGASALAGVRLGSAAWFYPGGGWVDPRGLARSFLGDGPSFIDLRLGVDVAQLRQEGEHWILLDAQGRTIVQSSVVVLANAGAALDLLGRRDWPIASTRGQITGMRVDASNEAAFPRIPVAGAGYVVPPIDGSVWFGATSQAHDDDASVRAADQRENVRRLAAVLGSARALDFDGLMGRTAWRWVSDDRLPVIGPVPVQEREGDGHRRDQPRFAPRQVGLFVCTALGSRGIAVSVLGARIVAAAIVGAPSPVEADLLDAVDPARFAVRAFRRGARPLVETS